MAIILGCISAFFITAVSDAFVRFKIDDPMDMAGVHIASGALGVLSAGFVAKPELVAVRRGELVGVRKEEREEGVASCAPLLSRPLWGGVVWGAPPFPPPPPCAPPPPPPPHLDQQQHQH